jgi:hypothetical protein
MALLNLDVDLRSRCYAFRGLTREPPRSFAPAGSHSARTSHRTLIGLLEFAHAQRKSDSIFEESSTLRSNQQVLKSTVSFNRAKYIVSAYNKYYTYCPIFTCPLIRLRAIIIR